MLKKSTQADIGNLFRKFGGDTSNYKEIQQDYVDEKAQQSWPIVAAMEKERVSAPMLKAAASNQRPRPAVGSSTGAFAVPAPIRGNVASNTGSFVAMPASAQRAAPVAEPIHQSMPPAAKAPAFSIFAQPAAVVPVVPVASVQGLFGALVAPVKEEAVAVPVANGATHAALQHSAHDPLKAVFSRLVQPQNEVASPAPDNSLRSILGFLKK